VSKIKKYDGQYDDLGEPTRKKHIKYKYKKKLPKWVKKFNKQSDYRKRATRKNKK